MDGDAVFATSSIYARVVLGGIFLWAGFTKLRQLVAFEGVVAGFDLLPGWSIAIAARVIPLVEVGLGVLFFVGVALRWIAAAAFLLTGAFTLAIVITLIRGLRRQCLCFGSDNGVVGWWTIQRNLGLLGLCGIVAIFHPPTSGIDSLFSLDVVAVVPFELAVVTFAVSLAATVMWLVIGEALRYRAVANELIERKRHG